MSDSELPALDIDTETPEEIVLVEEPAVDAEAIADTEIPADTGAEEENFAAEPGSIIVDVEEIATSDVPAVVADAADSGVAIDESHFPDEYFRAYVKRYCDENGDGVLSQAEADKVTTIGYDDYISIDGECSSLVGISYFPNLSVLYCDSNMLKELDISENKELTELICSDNPLKELDVSKNTKLRNLKCHFTELTELDVSKNTELTILDCANNNLKTLDVSRNTKLTNLDCAINGLTTLDVSANPDLIYLDCGDNQLTELDVSDKPSLVELGCDGNQLTELDVSANPDLMYLFCSDNQLKALDVSANPSLTELECAGNQLTELDVSANPDLTYLYCGDNQLTKLDVGSIADQILDGECGAQKREISLKAADSGLKLDMAELVGAANLGKVSELKDSDGNALSMGTDGIISFPKEGFPETISYIYDTGYSPLEVTLTLRNAPEHVHSYVTVTSKEPTCTETGSTYEECSECHEKKEGSEKTLPALGHTGGTATCAAKAVCTRCGQPYGSLSTTHSFGAYKVTKEPTVLAEGTETRSCSVCGVQESRPVAKLAPTIKLSATSIKLKVKQSTTKVTVSGLARGDEVASWKSSNTKIVTVNNKGKITAKAKKGKATVTVTLKSGLSKKITVTVQKDVVNCTKVTLNQKSITLKKGKTFALKATISPITCVQKAKYTTSNKSVATVSASGKIKAKKKGTATITVTVGKKKAKCKVKVK